MRYYYKDNNGNYYSYKSKHNDLIAITEQQFLDAQPKPKQPTAEQIALQEKHKEMAQIKQWLNEHDYIINKHLLGEYTDNDERWLNYLAERKIKLDRYNELEK